MSKRQQRLQIDSHTDCVIIMNAVREHCQKQNAAYQAAFIRATQEGDEKRAQEFLRWRDQAYACQYRTLARLERIKKKFESMMDAEPDDRGDGVAASGYSTDNATCYN